MNNLETNSVFDFVKYNLCNYFSLYKTRIDVLGDALLFMSGDWTLDKSKNEYYLKINPTNKVESETIPLLEEKTIKSLRLNPAEIDFENGIRTLINNNLDEYCKGKVSSSYLTNLNKEKISIRSYSKDYCLLNNCPDNISNDWKKAIIEVCEHYINLINSVSSGLEKYSQIGLDYVRRYKPEYGDLYLSLINTHKRFSHKKVQNSLSLMEILGIPTIDDIYNEKYKDKLSFERFNKLVKHRLNGRQLINTSLEDYIDETLRFEKENIMNNELTDQFKDDLIYNLNNKTSWEYIDLGSLYSMTTYRLNIPEPYETKVQNFLLDYFNCISCS